MKMITIEEAQELLDELAQELPSEIFKELNGGILLLPEAKLSPDAKHGDLYIMGQYCRNYTMGRYVVIYFGSFERLYGGYSKEGLKKELKETLYHELTHHLESLAGERDLELQDEEDRQKYLERNG